MALHKQLLPKTGKEPESLTRYDLVDYLIQNPKAKGKFRFSGLRSPAWSKLLSRRPEFIDQCNTAKIRPDCAAEIIIAQPQLLPYFSPARIDWQRVLSKRPELIDKMPKDRHFARSSWASILSCQPGLWDHSPKKFSSDDWSLIIDYQPQLADKCPWREMYFCRTFYYFHWKKCLLKYPDLILGRRPDWKDYYNLDNLESMEVADILCCNPEIEKLVDFSVFNYYDWKMILEKQPQFIKYCDVQKIFSRFPLRLIAARPELAKYFDLKDSRVELSSDRQKLEFISAHPQLACKVLNSLSQEGWITLLYDHPEYLVNREGWKYSFAENTQAFVAANFWDFEQTGLDSICNKVDSLLGKCAAPLKGLFRDALMNKISSADFLLKRVMDPFNAQSYFLQMLKVGDWNFIDGFNNIDPKFFSDFINSEDIPFFLVTVVRDRVLEQLLDSVSDPAACRDRNGNTLLHAALVRATFDDVKSLLNTDNPYRQRYDDLLILGCDPDQKNKFGFSCNDLIDQIKQFINRKD